MPVDRFRPWSFDLARVLVALPLLATIVLALIAGFEESKRQSIIRLVAVDLDAAARHLADTLVCPDPHCPTPVLDGSDLATLMAAITATETLGTSALDRALEQVIVRGALFIGLPAPDLSIGPAQIRVSTAQASAQWLARLGCATLIASDADAISRDLLTSAGAHKWGILILARLAAERAIPVARLNRTGIMRLSAEFNGQLSSPDAEAGVANALYRELVYRTYLELKFRLGGAITPCPFLREHRSSCRVQVPHDLLCYFQRNLNAPTMPLGLARTR